MSAALDELVALIQQSSGSQPELKQLLGTLKQQEPQLIQMMPQLDDAAEALAPQLHTLGLIFILSCKAPGVPTTPNVVDAPNSLRAVQVFIAQCRRMLLAADPIQVQMVPSHFVNVCRKFTDAAIAVRSPISAVRPLQAAACALQPSAAHFTPIHADFMRICLLSKCYVAAQPLLDQELLQVDKEGTLVTPRDLLLYHYYAGMVQVGLKRFRAAVDSFTLCFSAPTAVLNAIMVEAYKKCMLCTLIQSGEQVRSPKYTAPSISRHVKSLTPYVEYVEEFGKRKMEGLRACLEKHGAAFERDHNLGLAKQCLQALIKFNIQRLTTTYLTLSLAHIAERVELSGAAEAERYAPRAASERRVLLAAASCALRAALYPLGTLCVCACRYVTSMVGAGEISAAIDESQGMVHFTERSESHSSAAAIANMESNIAAAIELARKLSEMNSQLSADPHYLQRITSQERQPRWDEDAMVTK